MSTKEVNVGQLVALLREKTAADEERFQDYAKSAGMALVNGYDHDHHVANAAQARAAMAERDSLEAAIITLAEEVIDAAKKRPSVPGEEARQEG